MQASTCEIIDRFIECRDRYLEARKDMQKIAGDKITSEQFVALKMAYDGDIGVTDLAKRCGVQGPSLTRMLDTLEIIKAIKRIPDPADNRRTIVRIQAKGVKLLRAAK